MIRMIDRVTGVEIYVADSKVEEYLAAGHKLAAGDPPKNESKAPKRKKAEKK